MLAAKQFGRPTVVEHATTTALVVVALLAAGLLISIVSKSDNGTEAGAIVEISVLQNRHEALSAQCTSLVADAKTLCVVGVRLHGEVIERVESRRKGRLAALGDLALCEPRPTGETLAAISEGAHFLEMRRR